MQFGKLVIEGELFTLSDRRTIIRDTYPTIVGKKVRAIRVYYRGAVDVTYRNGEVFQVRLTDLLQDHPVWQYTPTSKCDGKGNAVYVDQMILDITTLRVAKVVSEEDTQILVAFDEELNDLKTMNKAQAIRVVKGTPKAYTPRPVVVKNTSVSSSVAELNTPAPGTTIQPKVEPVQEPLIQQESTPIPGVKRTSLMWIDYTGHPYTSKEACDKANEALAILATLRQ